MKTTLVMAAVVSMVLGAGSAMARGPELQNRVGAFGKGGTGLVVRAEPSPQRAAEAGPEVDNASVTEAARCPKCRTEWRTTPPSGKRSTATRSRVMKCEDCRNALTNFLARGEFKHTCKTCGDKVEEMCRKH